MAVYDRDNARQLRGVLYAAAGGGIRAFDRRDDVGLLITGPDVRSRDPGATVTGITSY
jgi:hypothetical protein